MDFLTCRTLFRRIFYTHDDVVDPVGGVGSGCDSVTAHCSWFRWRRRLFHRMDLRPRVVMKNLTLHVPTVILLSKSIDVG